jgi:hypothetical protein
MTGARTDCGTFNATFLSYGIGEAASLKREVAVPGVKGIFRRQSACEAEGAGCRHLAIRVIDQAFRDLSHPAGSPADRASARDFLAGSSMLRHWCHVANLDPVCLMSLAKKLTSESGS